MPVVMMSGHGTIDTAIEATRIGAFDFLEKPIALQKLLKTVATALKHSEQLPKSEISLANLGKSQIVVALKERLEKVATSSSVGPSPVLLIGNKGCGAELCARFLQNANTPWLEITDYSQLVTAPLDILDQTRDGVIYLAEISELNKTEQKGLLLMITKADRYNVRVVCGASQNLPKLQAEGLFDHNLLQLLSAVSLRIPALEEHKEDIPELVIAMASQQFELADIPYRDFEIAALNAMRNANWPGDIAQLDVTVRNLIQTSLGEKITLDDVNRVLHLFDDFSTDSAVPLALKVSGAESSQHLATEVDFGQPLREARDEFERLYFAHHIKSVAGNMSKLAEVSGLERTHLYRKLKQLDIKIKG
jgi:DNA-binding NtrC family response regulator